MQIRSISIATVALAAFGSAHAISLTSAGYFQNFDSMGTSGTSAPTDWRVFVGESGTSNTTWTTGITANGASASVASMVATTAALTAITSPTATNNNGYNAALNASTTGDRVLATSPTSFSGAALELTLTNTTGASFDTLAVSYDMVRFTSVATANELPGYQLFFSLGGNVWNNVASLNPSLASMPNNVGVASVANASFNLGAMVAAGQTLSLRWVDDNANQTSPDQIIGLNNVSVSAVPEPETLLQIVAGLVLVAGLSSRRRR